MGALRAGAAWPVSSCFSMAQRQRVGLHGGQGARCRFFERQIESLSALEPPCEQYDSESVDSLW